MNKPNTALLPVGTIVKMLRSDFVETGRVDIRNHAIRLVGTDGQEWVVGRIFGRYTQGGRDRVADNEPATMVTLDFGKGPWSGFMASANPTEFVEVEPAEWAGLVLPDYRDLLDREEVRQEVIDLVHDQVTMDPDHPATKEYLQRGSVVGRWVSHKPNMTEVEKDKK